METKKIKKSQRVEAITQVLKRWGELDKEMLDHRVSSFLGVDSKSVSKNLYRDLSELVDDGKVLIKYFTKDGLPIDNFDEDQYKSYKCSWCIPDYQTQFRGQKLIENYGGKIILPKILSDDVIFSDLSEPFRLKTIQIIFPIGSNFYALTIHEDILPFNLVISRSMDDYRDEEFKELYKLAGMRTIWLFLPISSISSTKVNNEILGHVQMKFDGEKKLEITDLNSSNGTFFSKIDLNDLEELKTSYLDLIQGTYSEEELFQNVPLPEMDKISGTLKQDFPLVMSLGKSFKLIIS